jgi:hypothetical protein
MSKKNFCLGSLVRSQRKIGSQKLKSYERRKPVMNATALPNQIKKKMRHILTEDHETAAYNGRLANSYGIGQVNFTLLAETVVDEMDLPWEWLDDETHFIWDLAIEVAERWEEEHDAPY